MKRATMRRSSWRRSSALVVLAATAACSSVEVPSERYYRLQLPAQHAPDPQRAGTLRVADLQLGTALDSDRLLRQTGVRLEPLPLTRWIAPLDRLVTDALVLGLSRARVCDLVKGSADPGPETWMLHGRIVDFVEATAPDGEGREARVNLELWLESEGALMFHDEFAVTEPVATGGSTDAAVDALSRALHRVVDGVVVRMRERDLFAAALARRIEAARAEPPR